MKKIFLPLIVAAGAASSVPAVSPEAPALFGFEDLAGWDGLLPEKSIVAEGSQAGRWIDTPTNNRIRLRAWEGDLSTHDGLQFWCWSAQATGAEVAFVIRSDNEASDGPDYWMNQFLVDWTGWKLIEMPFAPMRAVREPAGLDSVTEILFASTGYGVDRTDPATELVLDALAPLGTPTKEPSGDRVAPAAEVEEPERMSPEELKALLGFEDATLWRGLQPNTSEPRQGAASAVWEDLTTTTRIECPAFRPDLSGAEALEFWLKVDAPQPTAIAVIIESENELTEGPDYWRATLPVTWLGWKRVRMPLEDFTMARAPKGWDAVTGMRLASTEYSLPGAAAGTRLEFDGMEIVRKEK